jgi:hypothetical protein
MFFEYEDDDEDDSSDRAAAPPEPFFSGIVTTQEGRVQGSGFRTDTAFAREMPPCGSAEGVNRQILP